MPAYRQVLEALAQICRDFGGQLVTLTRTAFYALLDDDDDSDISTPGTAGSRLEYGIHWERKIIYAMRGTRHIGFIIHEAGHVFADRHPPDHRKCDEWEWLGWEIAVAQKLGVWGSWSRQNGNYALGDGIGNGVGKDKTWYDLTAKEKRAIVADRLVHAKKIGILAEDGTPRSVR